MTAYYNEIEPHAAAWLRELIRENLIAPGEVDERDIQDVCPADLHGFTQCHFFAGIGVWSYALRRAGWPDDRPVWTASCPCQPFSSAGKGAGFDDERHLWPAVDWLAQQCQPECIFGEQVASKDAEPWLDLVQADLEGLGYAFAACAFPSAGVGAPHIRDRTYWVAQSPGVGCDEGTELWPVYSRHQPRRLGASDGRATDVLVDTHSEHKRPAGNAARAREFGRSGEVVGMGDAGRSRATARIPEQMERQGRVANVDDHGGDRLPGSHARKSKSDGLANAESEGQSHGGPRATQPEPRGDDGAHRVSNEPAGPTNGLWGDADWLFCRDGKWRPVEPGTFPLAHGAASRVGRLRGYGNAINAEAATAFIRSYLEVREAA